MSFYFGDSFAVICIFVIYILLVWILIPNDFISKYEKYHLLFVFQCEMNNEEKKVIHCYKSLCILSVQLRCLGCIR